jgi:hypothetical protein
MNNDRLSVQGINTCESTAEVYQISSMFGIPGIGILPPDEGWRLSNTPANNEGICHT